MRLKVLDVCCGLGGWSKPFLEAGDDVTGVDIVDVGYPGKLVVADIRTIVGGNFRGYDLIIGSPPCRDFSTAANGNKGYHGRRQPDPSAGLELVGHFERIVIEARPLLWAMENVRAMEKWKLKILGELPTWHFKISKGGYRTLWANWKPILRPQFEFSRELERINSPRRLLSWVGAEIPRPIADFVAGSARETVERLIEIRRVFA